MEGTLWRQKKIEKSRTMLKKIEKGTFTLIQFCRLRLKSKKPKGRTLWNNLDAFLGIRLASFI